jgi:hypothetical protein
MFWFLFKLFYFFITGTPPNSASFADSDQSAHSADPASVAAALKDIKMAIQATRVLQHQVRNHIHNISFSS